MTNGLNWRKNTCFDDKFEGRCSMNQTIETLLKRRSIRKYKSDQISDADLKLILDTGLYAPTLIIALSLIGHGNAMADCALALGNMQNAAASLGLGSCYVNQMHWLTDNSNLREYIYAWNACG